MSVDETTLRAWVDGELEPELARHLEAMVAASEELQQQVRLLRASQLPYQAAFDAQPMPEVPAELRRRVEAWIALSDESHRPLPVQRRRWLGFGAAVAASFAAGLWVPIPLRLQPVAQEDPAWIQAIARYQALYVRETFDRTSEDPERARAVLASFVAEGGRHLSIPDLQPLGLTLRRVQRLAVGDLPLIQMEYLPARGKPMSLCVLAVRQVDTGVLSRRIEGLGVSTWRRGGLQFVMVADLPVNEVDGMASRLASGELPVLYRSSGA
jgi:anti-sigma factor RsiW